MKEIEKLVMELGDKCRENKLNFMIVVEDKDKGIYSNHSVSGKSELRDLVKALKERKE